MNKIKTAIIFGGSVYIGKNLLSFFIKNNTFSNYIIGDIKELIGFDKEDSVSFIKTDVRNSIDLNILINGGGFMIKKEN